MSYEGYEQCICKNGHYFERDCYDDSNCHVCHHDAAWANGVDTTNGDDSGYIPVDKLRKLYLVSPVKVEVCNLGHSHVTSPEVFLIPDENVTGTLRTYDDPEGAL